MNIPFLDKLHVETAAKKEKRRRERNVSSLMKKIKRIRPDAEIRRGASIDGKPVGDIIAIGDRVFCVFAPEVSGKMMISFKNDEPWTSIDDPDAVFGNPFADVANRMKIVESAMMGAKAASFSQTDYVVLGVVYCPEVKAGSKIFGGNMPPERQAIAFTKNDFIDDMDIAEPLPSDVPSSRLIGNLVDDVKGAAING